MERIVCPVCGHRSLIAWGTAAEIQETAPTAKVVGIHVNEAGRCCWAVGLSVDYAAAVGRILAEGGERFRLAAHP